MVAKLGFGYSFSPLDLIDDSFVRTLGQNQGIGQAPWYVSMDGVLFL